MRRGFTLVELLVVISLIILLSTLSVPAVHTYLASRQNAVAIQAFSRTVTNAQVLARANFTTTAVRVERAFRTDEAGRMVKDAAGQPIWLDHQQMRILAVGLRQTRDPIPKEELAFRQLQDMGTASLPDTAWLAPDDGLTRLATGNTVWQPPIADVAAIDTLDTFYIVFNRRGELTRLPANRLVYLDETQDNAFVGYPRPSSAGAITYNREQFEKSGRDPHWIQLGISLYVDQRTGSVIGGEQPR